MADNYIDYFEVDEYGGGFLTALMRLEGVATLVNVSGLRGLVLGSVQGVNQELKNAGITRSDLRGQRVGVEEATSRGRKELERFHSYLNSLDEAAQFDREAFFKRSKLGALSALKPADVNARLKDAIRGFDVPANVALPDRVARLAKLTEASDDLEAALADKGTSVAVKLKSTASLVQARERFLHVYNQVAKPLVRAELSLLGREREMRDFFPDLRVHEDRPPLGPKPPIAGDAPSAT
ncbi:hypothetical protein [Chondromyces crocatus]|uniref:Uncharacterized protein n=1 Tax=Chondromyces crocatus TaxID=52 RepID=A0A0K1EQR0_CHOCO|nr:hypothetical protein [Chondromyces crocatus]AKT42963.1 uncharacterized protein CMC5_071910 [Chondromyces crocatus]